jgi:hypothetical protein
MALARLLCPRRVTIVPAGAPGEATLSSCMTYEGACRHGRHDMRITLSSGPAGIALDAQPGYTRRSSAP